MIESFMSAVNAITELSHLPGSVECQRWSGTS